MSNKKNAQVKQQIFHHFAEIIELFPQYTIAQHIIHVMRPKTGSYEWTEEQLLKRFEKYRDELENDHADQISEKIID